MSCKQCSKFSLHGEMHCRRNDRDVDGPWVLPLWLDQLRQHPEAVFRQLCWSNFQGVTLKKTDVMNNIQGDWNLLSGRNADLFFYTKSFSGCRQASSWLYAGICFCFSILGLFFFFLKKPLLIFFPFLMKRFLSTSTLCWARWIVSSSEYGFPLLGFSGDQSSMKCGRWVYKKFMYWYVVRSVYYHPKERASKFIHKVSLLHNKVGTEYLLPLH